MKEHLLRESSERKAGKKNPSKLRTILRKLRGTRYLPFKRLELFSSRADEALHSLKDLWATLRSLGVYTLSLYRKSYRYQPQQR